MRTEDMMMKEYDTVVLTEDLPVNGLRVGDIGTVVLIHQGDAGYEVEFITLDGETIAVTDLLPSQIRPVARYEMPHVRKIAS